MDKKLFSLLTLSLFIGINTQSPTDAAGKINGILSQVGVITTADNKQQYVEVSPDAGSINTYNTNHECIASQQISARMKQMLSKKNLDGAEQEEATFAAYRLGTKLQTEQTPDKNLERERKIITFNAHIIPRILAFAILPVIHEHKIFEKCPLVTKILTPLILVNLVDSHYKTFICNLLNRRYKEQDEEKLDKQTFYNLGFHTDGYYLHLFKKMNSPLFKKAFEEGRKAQQDRLKIS